MLLTWKEIKDAVENGHSQHKVKDSDLLTYLIVHLDTVAFGQVGQSGTMAHTNNYHTPKGEEPRSLRARSEPSDNPMP